jgi:hypothetical protein
MVKTVVLIGKFAGELNSIKEALENINSKIRCISFLDADNALPIMLKDRVLYPDYIIVDETFPSTSLPLLRSIRVINGNGVPLVLFTKSSISTFQNPINDVFAFTKSANKNDYFAFLDRLITEPVPS